MTCNITETPLDFEPLPLYQRDPETSSIISSAPSYRSDAPTYHSRCSTLVDSAASPPQYIISTSLLDISAPPRLRQTTSSSTNNSSTRNNANSNGPATAPAEPPPDASVPRSQGLPAPRSFAPGFESRSAHYVEPNPSPASASINHWSSIQSSHARQQYQNVARRRASRAAGMQSAQRTVALFEQHGGSNHSYNSDAVRTPSPPALAMNSPSAEALRPSSPGAAIPVAPLLLSSTSPPPPSLSPVPSSTGTSSIPAASSSPPPPPSLSRHHTTNTRISPHPTPTSFPLEDPSLVGEAAARRARQQRLYREACRRHEHAERMAAEGRAWDFLLAQMTDWDDRERSWGAFRREVDARGFGLGGGGTAFGGRLLGSGSSGAVRFMTGGAGVGGVGVVGAGGVGRGHGRRFSVGGWHFGGRSRSRGF